MCNVCIDFVKGKLTKLEVERNLKEMINTSNNEEDKEHYKELEEEFKKYKE